MVDQRLEARRERRIGRQRLAAGPAPRPVATDRSVGILAERGGERPFVARIGRQAFDCRAAAMLERSLQRLGLGPRGGQCGPSARQSAFRSVPALGRSGAFLLGLLEPWSRRRRLRRLRTLRTLQRFAARSLFRRPSPSLRAATSSFCRSCSVRSTCARAASSAASATRRSARIAAWRVNRSASAASASRDSVSRSARSRPIRADCASSSARR